ncbi:MAG: Do family serine endopeptidase [Alphaproteobacteria bacterium]|nr:Do family serine endopeptidase [Alphaproteobacteria bacterium]
MAVKTSHLILGSLAAAALGVAAFAGANMAPGGFAQSGLGHLIKAATEPVMESAPPGQPMSFADIFAKVSPAVVSIHVTSKVDVSAMPQLRGIPGIPGLPFNLVPRGDEGGDDQDDGGATSKRAPKQMSSGSGFFISPDGYIVTNNHVVENAEDIKVILKDGKELKATVVGRDEDTDLAVIRVAGSNYPYVDFENRARPRVGDWVLAVGNPYDLGGTATAGIVSAFNRDIGERFVDYIQIDAPINRGNSGGPTFDVYGRVIGVNTAIFSPSGGSVGIGFDIPADVAESVTKQLMTGHKIQRGYIGATIEDLTDELATSWGLEGKKGAVVAGLVPGGPSSRAGLKVGDVIVKVNGQDVDSATAVTREVAKAQVGGKIQLDLYRNGKPASVTITAGLRPSEEEIAQNGGLAGGDEGDSAGAEAPHHVMLGMTLAPLDAAARQAFNISSDTKGVLIQSVKSNSDAADKGVHRGDVIVRAGDREVTGTGDIASALAEWKKAGRTSIPLEINRNGASIFIPIKIDG